MGKETVLAVRGTPLSKAPPVSLLWACWRRRASLLREARTAGLPPAPEAASWAALAPDCVAEALAAQQHELAALAAAGVSIVAGAAHLLADNLVSVDGPHGAEKFQSNAVVLATGLPILAPLAAIGEQMTVAHLLALPQLPPAVTIVADSLWGVELAQLCAEFGAAVLLVGAPDQLVSPLLPAWYRQRLQAEMTRAGIRVVTGVEEIDGAAPTPVVDLRCREFVSAPFAQSRITLAAGSLATNEASVWAAGGVIGVTAHYLAMAQGRAAGQGAAGDAPFYAPQALPQLWCTDPPLAQAGLAIERAGQAGYRSATSFASSERPCEAAAELCYDEESALVLGVVLAGAGAASALGEATLALEMGATVVDLAEILQPGGGCRALLGQAARAAAHVFSHQI
jgi:dihydrolipoamide dehydrogenase